MIKRIVIVGTSFHIKKIKNIEFVRIRENQKFKFLKTDLVVIFNQNREIEKGKIALFSEDEPNNFNGFIKSIDTKEVNKIKFPLLLSFLNLS